ncbi:hypothetical protein NDU88_003563 [Pleurodeles waltl]|uniref:Uncharacterized protein n=1 Tax=Pleurodeles waltl TaxID=8319 RepID=A0AAV7SG68_PLEWA|nr:hypothetical protein NDU88_003563 [Pleurodeles waltl]
MQKLRLPLKSRACRLCVSEPKGPLVRRPGTGVRVSPQGSACGGLKGQIWLSALTTTEACSNEQAEQRAETTPGTPRPLQRRGGSARNEERVGGSILERQRLMNSSRFQEGCGSASLKEEGRP